MAQVQIKIAARNQEQAKQRQLALQDFANKMTPNSWEILEKMGRKENLGQTIEQYGSMILSI
tara:strand:- start:305 stop:490 length:186 start_codon:yes stop_codon:yes gene_type:complete